MNKKSAFFGFLCYVFGIMMGILILAITGNLSTEDKIPYEQSYDYLFNRVDSYPNHIIRTQYYGKDYL